LNAIEKYKVIGINIRQGVEMVFPECVYLIESRRSASHPEILMYITGWPLCIKQQVDIWLFWNISDPDFIVVQLVCLYKDQCIL
jgi:hypothetical protein